MMKKLPFLVLLLAGSQSFGQSYLENKTLTYDEANAAYDELAQKHKKYCKVVQFGKSDYGKNISLFIISKDGSFNPELWEKKSRLLINNAIHPGEPCGVDASVKLATELLQKPEKLPENVIIGIIPIYNVGGAHNRSCCSRANQNGPEEYGFRGNAKNLDLNRDFIKADSKNTLAFYKIFQFLDPHIFVDTHTSNGADYKHIMTLITSQTDKMHPVLREYTTQELNDRLYDGMSKEEYHMVPYVHQYKQLPEDGIIDYLETPRYSTGFTNLFNCIGFVSETHMLKTFEERVESTYTLLKVMINHMENNSEEIITLKNKANEETAKMKFMPLAWKLDTTKYDMINFEGYTAEYIQSEVTGQKRLFYNHEKPWKKDIRYYNRYKVTDSVLVPDFYVIPQAWKDVVVRLQLAGIDVYRFKSDTKLNCEAYYIDDHATGQNPYEGHYLHRNIEVTKEEKEKSFIIGDYLIPVRNKNAQFIVQTLEPHAPDSYFAWNFFDAILQQKEWFSAYVFEETAKEMLANDPELKKEFLDKKAGNATFANSGWEQLYWLYKKSPNYERTHNQYPVYRYFGALVTTTYEKAPSIFGL